MKGTVLVSAALAATALLTSCASYQFNVPPPKTGPSPSKSNPVITWAQPAPVTENTPLGSAQLDATANVVGTFAYTPDVGAVLPPGMHTLSAVFTPFDTADYNSVTASVDLFVAGDSGPSIQTSVAVADSGNGRVLIFKSPLYTGMSASIVLGQPDFTSDTGYPPGPGTLGGPIGMDLDSAGNLYVVDTGNDRVMRFTPPFSNGMNATLEIGEPNLTSDPSCFRSSGTDLCGPYGVSLDAQGDVWVADGNGGRLLEYMVPIQQGMNPTLVIGHPDMSEIANCDGRDNMGEPGSPYDTTNASEMCVPGKVASDASGNLWVSDAGNGRILEFVPPFSDGMDATLEFGYPASVGMNSPTPWAQGWMCPSDTFAMSPMYCGLLGATFDVKGNLWAATRDGGVVEFVPPFSSGMSPAVVLGPTQPNQSGGIFGGPSALTFDPSGDLVVADQGGSRVLIFAPPFSSGMSPTVVLGQADATSTGPHGCGGLDGSPSASTFCQPQGVLVF